MVTSLRLALFERIYISACCKLCPLIEQLEKHTLKTVIIIFGLFSAFQ